MHNQLLITNSKKLLRHNKILLTYSKLILKHSKLLLTYSKILLTNGKILLSKGKKQIFNSKNKITSIKNKITDKWASANSGLAQLGFSANFKVGFVLGSLVLNLYILLTKSPTDAKPRDVTANCYIRFQKSDC